MSEAVICGFDRAWFIGRCSVCRQPMLEDEVGICPDCRERLLVKTVRSGGRGKTRRTNLSAKERGVNTDNLLIAK